MKLPSIKKILREDLGADAPSWTSQIIDPVNSFMEAVYQSLNRNITNGENIASTIKELTVRTSSAYPVMDEIKFDSGLKLRAMGVSVMQCYEKGTYVPATGPVYAAWVEINGQIIISSITGLVASKVYIIRFLVE